MIALLILAGHLLGDWVVQSDWQARMKVRPEPTIMFHSRGWRRDRRTGFYWRSWRANQAHMASYHATLAVFVLPVWWSWHAAVFLAVSWATHSFFDRRWPVRWLLAHTGSAQFATRDWGVLCADQALHVAVLAVAFAVLH